MAIAKELEFKKATYKKAYAHIKSYSITAMGSFDGEKKYAVTVNLVTYADQDKDVVLQDSFYGLGDLITKEEKDFLLEDEITLSGLYKKIKEKHFPEWEDC